MHTPHHKVYIPPHTKRVLITLKMISSPELVLESTAQGFPRPARKQADLTPVVTAKAHQNLALGQRSIKIRYDELFGQLELLLELSAAPGSPATTAGPSSRS